MTVAGTRGAFAAVASVTGLPAARPGNRARDWVSQAARTRVTCDVTGSLRLRFPLGQTMSMSWRCR